MKTLDQLKKERSEQQTSGDIALTTLGNVPASGAQFVKDTITPLLSPIDTAKSLVELGKGIYNLSTPGEQPSEEVARAVGKFYSERYGGADFEEVKSNVLRTLQKDPVGFLADLAIPLSIARAPLSSSSVISKATKAIDPTTALLKSAKKIPKGLYNIGEVFPGSLIKRQAGIGEGVLTTIFKGAEQGGDLLKSMKAQMSSNKSLETTLKPVTDYMEGLKILSAKRSAQYKEGIAKLGLDKVKVDPAIVKKSFNKAQLKYTKITQKGRFSTPQITKKTKELQGLVDEWINNPGLHTVEGLDFLKQSISDYMPDITSKGQSAAFVTDFQNNIRASIRKEFPDYVPVMKAYEDSKILETQIKKALGTGKIQDIEAISRKLQSTTKGGFMKDSLLDELSKAGEQPYLKYKLAAGSVDNLAPTGLGGYSSGAIGGGGILYGLGTGNLPLAALAAGSTAASSPRLLGEVALQSGRLKGAINPALNKISDLNKVLYPTYRPALQASRATEATGMQEEAERARRAEFLRKLKQ